MITIFGIGFGRKTVKEEAARLLAEADLQALAYDVQTTRLEYEVKASKAAADMYRKRANHLQGVLDGLPKVPTDFGPTLPPLSAQFDYMPDATRHHGTGVIPDFANAATHHGG